MSSYVTKVVIQGDDKTQGALASASRGIQQYGKAAKAANAKVQASSRASRGAIQQIGYQAQDIAVQLQAGQNPFLVLSQQGSQVASVFGAGGAVAGAFIAIAGIIGMNLLPKLFETNEELKKLRESGVGLVDKMGELSGDTLLAARAMAVLQKEIKNEELKKAEERLAEIAPTLKNLGDRGKAATDEFKELRKEQIELTAGAFQLRLELDKLDNSLYGKKVDKFVDTDEATKNLKEGIKLYEQGQKLLEKLVTPLQQLQRLQASYDKAVQDGLISEMESIQLKALAEEQYLKSLPKKKEEVDLTKKQAEAYEKLKRSLDPAYAAYQSYYEAVTLINNSSAKQSEKTTMLAVAYAKLYEAITPVKEKLDEQVKTVDAVEMAMQKYHDSLGTVETSLDSVATGGIRKMEDALTDLVAGTTSVSDAFRDMASSIIKDLIRMQIQQSITKPLSGLLSGAMYESSSNFVGPPQPGSGGIMDTISGWFSASGGGYTGMGARSGGIDGKGGFPAILHPNETVVDHAQGQSLGEGVTINQTIQISTGVSQTVRAEIANLMPQITNATKAAVADARQRGGGFSKSLVGA